MKSIWLMIQKRGRLDSGNLAPTITFNPAPSLALSILSSHYYHNHIANKITIQQIRQKTRVVLHINHISHHRHRPLSLYLHHIDRLHHRPLLTTNKGYPLQLASILQISVTSLYKDYNATSLRYSISIVHHIYTLHQRYCWRQWIVVHYPT